MTLPDAKELQQGGEAGDRALRQRWIEYSALDAQATSAPGAPPWADCGRHADSQARSADSTARSEPSVQPSSTRISSHDPTVVASSAATLRCAIASWL